MPFYRVYQLDHLGHINGPATVHEAPDDRAALRMAREHHRGVEVEVWEGARRIEPAGQRAVSPEEAGPRIHP